MLGQQISLSFLRFAAVRQHGNAHVVSIAQELRLTSAFCNQGCIITTLPVSLLRFSFSFPDCAFVTDNNQVMNSSTRALLFQEWNIVAL